MKKVIYTQRETTPIISVSEINNLSHVGFINENGEKGYIAYIGDYFKRICAYEGTKEYFCNPAYNGSEVFNNIQDAIIKKEAYNYTTFVFDTRKELYKWLSE